MRVLPIKKEEAAIWCKKRHYARRIPPMKHAYGLYDGKWLVGIITYGPTPTPAVQQNICGGGWAENVLELNRLCVDSDRRNAASILVGRSLRLLPRPKIIVSYADTKHGHVGYIYQATNFLYTGMVTAHDDEYWVNGVKIHARTLTARGISAPKEWARRNGIQIDRAQPKHRYVYFVGSRQQIKAMKKDLKYEVLSEYPKGDTRQYDMGDMVATQGLLL